MQPYRIGRPHGGECQRCGPAGPGHHLCQADGCRDVAVTQVRRHATLKEYLDLPISLRPIDGVAHQAVYACDDHGEDLTDFCVHAAPEPGPCPKCGAAGDASCVKTDGVTPRSSHASRPVVEAAEPCHHAHRENCGVFDGCRCTGDDPDPERPARPRGDDPGPDVSGLTIPLHIAQMVLAEARVPWALVTSVRSCLSQDNRPAISVDVRALDESGSLARDRHGHPVVDNRVIVLPSPRVTGLLP